MKDILLLLAGALIGWATSWYYYQRARKDSSADNQSINQKLLTLLSAEERAGHITLTRDAQGNITGGESIVIVTPSGIINMQGHAPDVSISKTPGS
jgi:hypothetical protein